MYKCIFIIIIINININQFLLLYNKHNLFKRSKLKENNILLHLIKLYN